MQVTLGASVYYAPANTIDINIHSGLSSMPHKNLSDMFFP